MNVKFGWTLSTVLTAIVLSFVSVSLQADEVEGSQVTHPNASLESVVAVKVLGQWGFCSGVVVGQTSILTASHCVYDMSRGQFFETSKIKIGVGENLFDDNTFWVATATINHKTNKNIQDVSDFLFNDVVELSTATTIEIPALEVTDSLTPDQKLRAVGFGEDNEGYYGIKKSRPLTKVTIDEKAIRFATGACRGDSGGPVLNEKNQIVGIISLSEVQHCVSEGTRIAQRL